MSETAMKAPSKAREIAPTELAELARGKAGGKRYSTKAVRIIARYLHQECRKGRYLTDIEEDPGMPTLDTIDRWAEADRGGCAETIARARKALYLALVEQGAKGLDALDDDAGSNLIRLRTEQANFRLKMAERADPDRWSPTKRISADVRVSLGTAFRSALPATIIDAIQAEYASTTEPLRTGAAPNALPEGDSQAVSGPSGGDEEAEGAPGGE